MALGKTSMDNKTNEEMEEIAKSRFLVKSRFIQWCESEGLSLITGYAVQDLRTAAVRPWDRLGGPAAYCHLAGSQGYVGSLVAEIPPGKSLKPMRHMYEEMILILEGHGATQIWCEKTGQATTVEWQPGSIFSPPLNTKHQHFNGSATERVRFVAANNAPLVFNIFGAADFVFNAPFEFSDRFSGESDYFSGEMKPGVLEDTSVNFIADADAVKLTKYPKRGAGFSRLGISGSNNTAMIAHIMQIESGTYRKPHRHGPGAQVVVLNGKGYSLMWPPGGEFVRVNWRRGSLFVPPEGWYHSHFTASKEPGRHLAFRSGLRGVGTIWLPTTSEREGGHIMEHEDEPPEVRAMYEKELAKEGIALGMPPIHYSEERFAAKPVVP
ncbi:MAG TPA: ethanolamine ammonia lyase-activating protein [Candidatus Binatia bacterium]